MVYLYGAVAVAAPGIPSEPTTQTAAALSMSHTQTWSTTHPAPPWTTELEMVGTETESVVAEQRWSEASSSLHRSAAGPHRSLWARDISPGAIVGIALGSVAITTIALFPLFVYSGQEWW
jgi:hypothetical protein